MKSATGTRFPRPVVVLGVLLIVAVLAACEASACDLGPFPDSPFPDAPEIRCADDADSGPIPTETTLPPGSESLSGDAVALAALYNATDGPNWRNNTNWLTDAPISDWAGVSASNIVNGDALGECVVRSLSLYGNQLSGEIPAELLANLANLSSLNLSGNQLSGEIPAELGNLPHLAFLNLNGNQLSGEIPAELANLTNLHRLDLSDTQLNGTIPAELANLANLSSLDLSDNQLNGTIPAELANLTNLQRLDLSDNQLNGTIPAELGNLLNLEYLKLQDNQLNGTIPIELGNLPNLKQLYLNGNQLNGEIPAELGNLPNLIILDLSGNQLSGEIPAELGNLPNLILLYLSDNQLSGEIPIELGNLPKLITLDLSRNQLSGEIPAELGNLPKLRSLYLSDNQLSGEIPIELGNLPDLRLDGNQLSGWANGTNPQYAWDRSTIRVSWDAVDGADYYKVYHGHLSDDACWLGRDGSPRVCEELAADVVGTTYVHTTPNRGENYYWVVSCNSSGCSEIDSRIPAVDASPSATAPAVTPSPGQSGPSTVVPIAIPTQTPPTQTPTESDMSREPFEASTPSGYTRVSLTDRGSVWGTPERFTTDSSLGAVAYMLLGTMKGCSFADEELNRSSVVYAKIERLGRLSRFEAQEVCRMAGSAWGTDWHGLRIAHLRIFDESSSTNAREYVYDADGMQYIESLAASGGSN